MSRRKSASAPKQTRRKKITAKGHGAAQAVVRSRTDMPLRSAATKSKRRRHNEAKGIAADIDPSTGFQDDCNPTPTAPVPERSNDSDQLAPVIESPEIAFRDDSEQTISDNHQNRGSDLSSATPNVWIYQAKLLEMVQANMLFAFEFAQTFATSKKWWQ